MFPFPEQKRWLLCALIGALAAPMALAGIDDASRYSGTNAPAGWISGGHRGDIDFGLWEFEATANGGSAGRFLGDSSLVGASINTGGQAFGLFAHPPQATAPVAAAIRKFAKPTLTTGDTLSFQLAVNFRNGTKGFTLRNAAGTSQWNFSVGRVDGSNDGYYIRNGVSGSAFDNGQRFGGYSANTVFTFTFTQRERQLQWTAVRSGGISATVSGALTIDSGTIADLRFFITGTEPSGTEPRNNLYFNNLSLTTEPRGDAPLTIGERRTPGVVPSYLLRFVDPNVTAVTMRHGGDGFANSYGLAKGGDGIWSIDIRNVLTTPGGQPLQPGWHEFKFRLNSVFESGDNRMLFIDQFGRVAVPPALYLTWQRDPTTTMTVHWHTFDSSANLRWRVPGAAAWNTIAAGSIPAPYSERYVHTAEITGLNPGWIYEFQVDGYADAHRFRTMPSNIASPVKFAVAGDADVNDTADAMARAIAAKDPAFIAMIGDHAYENSRAEDGWRWDRYFQSWYDHVRAPDGRLIPIVAGVGNHEVYNGWGQYHQDFENTADWRLRYASYFYRYFAFPGSAQPYGVLDFGNYLSLLILDTEHSSPTITGTDAQSVWLSQRLAERGTKRHLLPLYHVPAYPSYRPFDGTSDDANRARRIRDHWVPLLQNNGVHLAFEHHDHAYKRTKPLLNGVENAGGIVFAGDGAWGVATRPPDSGRTYLQNSAATHHAFLVTISATNRTVEAIGTNGIAFDFFAQAADFILPTPLSPSPAVTGLASNAIALSWSPVAGAGTYRVLRDGTEVGVTAGTNFTDVSWTSAAPISYTVVAVNEDGTASGSSTATAAGHRQIWNVTNNLPWDSSGEGNSMADPDADGIANLAEYFHGLNPRVRDASVPLAIHGFSANSVSVRYWKNPGVVGVNGAVEWTPSLSSPAWTTSNVVQSGLTGDWTGWRAGTIPVTNGMPAGFLRLRISE